jgi:transposase
MGRHIHLQPHLSVEDLGQRYRAAKEPHERSWWQILWLLAQGRTATELASVTGYSAYWIGHLARRYNEQGPAGMHNRQHTTSRRAAPLLSAAQQEELRQALVGPAPDDDRWSGRTVAEWMGARLGRPVSRYRGWSYLHRLKPKPRQGVPRPRHALADPAEQEAFKKN